MNFHVLEKVKIDAPVFSGSAYGMRLKRVSKN